MIPLHRVSPLVIIPLLLATAGCGDQRAAPAAREADPAARLTIDDLERWDRERAWRSKEDLLQLYAFLRAAGRATDLTVDHDALVRLAGMSSLFPLQDCEAITCEHGLLRVRLTHARSVAVPGAYYQASLQMSREVVFAIEPPGPKDAPGDLVFALRAGEWKVHFSWLAKTLGPPFARDFHIRRATYHLDEAKREARLAIETGTHLGRGKLRVTPGQDRFDIDFLDDDHPHDPDLVITRDSVALPCVSADFVSHPRWPAAGEYGPPPPPGSLPELAASLIERAFIDIDGLLGDGLSFFEAYTYDLESRSVTRAWYTLIVGPESR